MDSYKVKPKLHIIVHHRLDRSQTYANQWLDENRLAAITTTDEVADLCQDAIASKQRIYVHRCAYGKYPAVICCSSYVSELKKFWVNSWLAKFSDYEKLMDTPSYQPMKGENCYRE